MDKILEMIAKINSEINNIVWGPPILVLLVGTGVLLAVLSSFVIYRKFGYILKNTLLKMFEKVETKSGRTTPFQAVSTALAATVGTGNIVGVTLAITIGGPGAVFWMWVAALVGMTTKVAEVTLAVATRETNSLGETVGGPMYYIKKGVKSNFLANTFAIFGATACFGIGSMTQSNSLAESVNATFGVPLWITGLVLAALVSLVIIGGIKRIGSVTEKLVPFMALFYIIGGIAILFIQRGNLINAISMIFKNAFTGTAAAGGFLGATVLKSMRLGVSRGVFTNEAGLGSAPIAHATAQTDHPVRQGIWGAFEVFVDTLIVCSITALCILSSDIWTSSEFAGAALTTVVFENAFKHGGLIVTFGLILFAFSTILGWSYYGEKCVEFLVGTKSILIFRIIFIITVFIGTIGGLKLVWDIADTLNGLMAIPNLIALVLLRKAFVRLLKDFFSDPNKIRPENEDYMRFFEK